MSDKNSSRMPGTRFSMLIGEKGQFSINEISSESCDVSEPSSTYTHSNGMIEHQFQPQLIRKKDNIKNLRPLLGFLNHGKPMPRKKTKMYLKHGHQLVKQYKNLIGAPNLLIENLDPFQFLEHIQSLEPELTKDSWATIRISALVILSRFTGICIGAAFFILFGDEELFVAPSEQLDQ